MSLRIWIIILISVGLCSPTLSQLAVAKKRRRPLPALLARPQGMPVVRPIPKAITSLLNEDNIAAAARRLYLEPASVKGLFLLREMERIGAHRTLKTPDDVDLHRYYLNLGIAYHNLYLFVRGQGADNRKFARKALAAYGKALRHADGWHRDEVHALRAALDLTRGKRKAAAKRFTKSVNLKGLLRSYQGATYLATYYAAVGDVGQTLTVLRRAKALDTTDNLQTWLMISDDFAEIRNADAFQQFWKQL